MARFCRYELRTSDVADARAFYGAVLGAPVPEVVPLPATAAARGAPAHWLGVIGVEDVEATGNALLERAATRLGQAAATGKGGAAGDVAVFRGPGGAVVGIAPERPAPSGPEVLWHELDTHDVERAMATYREVFGWDVDEPLDLGAAGVHYPFAWQARGPVVGSMADIAGRRGVHPQWLFHFAVPALEPALAAVRDGGGFVLATVAAPDGERVAVCDDPQGAGFALREPARATRHRVPGWRGL